MAKNDKKNLSQKDLKKQEAKAPKAPQQAPKAAPKVENPKTEEKVEEAETINISKASNPKNLVSRKHSGLSPDGQVQLLDLAHRVFVEERDPDLQFPKEVSIKVNKIVAVGILCTLADHASNGDDSFANVLHTQAYPSLASAAADLGFKIPDIKALPAGKEEGTVMLEAKDVKVPAETKKKLQEEKKIREGEKPELDPEKITSAEDVTKALQYMFLTGSKRLPKLMVEAIEFMKKFRFHEASLAENAEEAKAKFESYNAGDWLDDVFSYFRPPVFFTGIGRGMATVAADKKNPIHSFIILRDAIKDKDSGVPALSDQDTAYCAKSIIKWFCDTNIESYKKAIENLDPKKNKTEIEKCEAHIQYYNDILTYITSPSSEEIDTLLENVGSTFDEGGTLTKECQDANATFNRICGSYYGKKLSTSNYKNLGENIKQYGYHIINLFRAPGEQLVDCGLSYVSELEERSAEEREEMIKAAKKAWAERKSKEKKEEAKNA